ncbi:MAG: threonylcarbamoyl-AMP synthase [Candidatus Liptonbacteria bacterium]|nr:threonylcarbamoyl-AMP synthase [Candidatus Liptonbacteria bacterium]
MTHREVIKILKRNAVGVLPTDTIYGIVGSALRPKTVERIYKLRKRNRKKPMIILVSSITDLKRFGVNVDSRTKKVLRRFWPGKVSIILPCPSKKFTYLHRGAKTLAFRLPAKKSLRAFLKKTGPLVAPSANIEGERPARTVAEAKHYFGSRVDFYVDIGGLHGKPSKLVDLVGRRRAVVRA